MRKFWFLPQRLTIAVEAYRNSYSPSVEVKLGGDEGELILFHIAIPFIIKFWLWFTCWPLQHRLRLPDEARNTGFYLSWPLFHLEIWQKEHEWRRGDWSWSVNLEDLIFGRATYSKFTYGEQDVEIPMPEANYPARVSYYMQEWRRPRKKTVRSQGVWIEITGGIPHPGKGTTSYNCDDDALMGMGCSATTAEEAVQQVIRRVNWYRENYPL